MLKDSSTVLSPGMNRPSSRPTPMASRIQMANHRSRKDICLITGAPVSAGWGPVVLIRRDSSNRWSSMGQHDSILTD